MAGRDIITMSQKELKQLHVIHKVCEGGDDPEAGSRGSLVKRAADTADSKADKSGGRQGEQHRSRGKGSNRKLPGRLMGKVVQLYREKYQGLGQRLWRRSCVNVKG